MTQVLQYSRRVPSGWFALAHTLVRAPSRRRREFALTEPAVFRSECFAEDLPPVPPPMPVPRRSGRLAAAPLGLALAPLGLALIGAATALLAHGA